MGQSIIEEKIYHIRGYRVMLDRDLAVLYGVPTKSLNLAVKRNRIRFPLDFMFRLTPREFANLRFQNETSNWGGRRYLSYAFTEEGVAMLSSVLTSERAALVNIAIMRAFVKLRHAIIVRRDLIVKIERLEGRVNLLETDIRFLREDVKEKLPKAGPLPSVPKIKGFGKE